MPAAKRLQHPPAQLVVRDRLNLAAWQLGVVRKMAPPSPHRLAGGKIRVAEPQARPEHETEPVRIVRIGRRRRLRTRESAHTPEAGVVRLRVLGEDQRTNARADA